MHTSLKPCHQPLDPCAPSSVMVDDSQTALRRAAHTNSIICVLQPGGEGGGGGGGRCDDRTSGMTAARMSNRYACSHCTHMARHSGRP